MANAHRGQVDIKAGDKTYTLSFSHNAICELEDATGQPLPAIGKLMLAGDARTIRAVVWAALRDHHEDVDLKGAGDLIDADRDGVIAAVGRAFTLSQTQDAKANPRKAARAS